MFIYLFFSYGDGAWLLLERFVSYIRKYKVAIYAHCVCRLSALQSLFYVKEIIIIGSFLCAM